MRLRWLAVSILIVTLGSVARADDPVADPIDLAPASTTTAMQSLPDYNPTSDAWNGLSSFVRLAQGSQLSVFPVAALEWGDLDDKDILVLIYPQQRVDPGRLDAFIQAGGYVIIADDFGGGADALARLDLIRAEPSAARASRYYADRTYAPIATPLSNHPLARGVGDVVTNHPAVLAASRGADPVIGFDTSGGVVVAAGERGSGRFIAVSDPSIFINRMLQFPGNLQLTVNMFRWLSRNGRATRVVLLRGDVPMYGDPKPYIDDANASPVGRDIALLNRWLGDRSDWLLTSGAMRWIAGGLAILLILLVLTAMPVRRKTGRPDGAWLRMITKPRRDAPERIIAAVEEGAGERNFMTAACVLRDVVQTSLTTILGTLDPLHALPEVALIRDVREARGDDAARGLARVYRRLRALPSRSQAAAAWGGGRFSRRDFDQLYDDVAELCRTLGEPLT